MKLQLVKTAEGALCLTTKFEFSNGITVLDRAQNQPVIPGLNYAISLFSSSDTTMYVETSTLGRNYSSELQMLGVSEGNAAAKRLGSWSAIQYSNSEVEVKANNKEKAIAFFTAVAEVFHCDPAAVSKIDDFIEWALDNASEMQSDVSLAESAVKNLSTYGWYYTIPVLRTTFVSAIDGAATAAEMLSLTEDLTYIKRALGSIHKICHASKMADLAGVTPALGFNTAGLKKIIPFVAETVYASANIKKDGFFGALFLSFVFAKCFQVESQNRVNMTEIGNYFRSEWSAEITRYNASQYIEEIF